MKKRKMFDTLAERLGGILDRLTKRGALSERDVDEAMSEVRRALLEADVALEVVRAFIDKVRARAIGADVIRSVTPGQQVVKIVHDELVDVLGADAKSIELDATPPVPILMVGLQGSGARSASMSCRSSRARARCRSPAARWKPRGSAATMRCCSIPPAASPWT